MSSVMPKQSVTMEKIYDDTGKTHVLQSASSNTNDSSKDESSLSEARKEVVQAQALGTALSETVSTKNTWQNFHKVSNPTLRLYVYPHLAGNDELPVPGYTTAFNAYEKDHWQI